MTERAKLLIEIKDMLEEGKYRIEWWIEQQLKLEAIAAMKELHKRTAEMPAGLEEVKHG